MTSPRSAPAILRGGRLRKTARGVFTFAPFLATASAVALGALLSFAPTHIAIAQTPECAETSTQTYECRGALTATRSFTGITGQHMMVTDADGFSITLTGGGDALFLSTIAASTGMTINFDNNSAISTTGSAGGNGIDARHYGTGALSITTNGSITATSDAIYARTDSVSGAMTIMATAAITASGDNEDGINANHDGTGALSITTAGAIMSTGSGGRGIFASTTSRATTVTITSTGAITSTGNAIGTTHVGSDDITITTAAITTSGDHNSQGIIANTLSSSSANNITITTNGVVTARTAGSGIYASMNNTGATGTIRIDANADVIAGNFGIRVDTASDNNIVVSIDGTVNAMASSNPIAIRMRRDGTAGSSKLIMNTGAAIDSGDAVIAQENAEVVANVRADTDAILELAADAGDTPSSFPLADMANFTGFTYFEKTGAGTWILAGAQPEDKAFMSATFTAGTLRLNAATFRPGSAFAVPAGTTLEVMGESSIHAALDSSAGAVTLATSGDATATDDQLSVTDFAKGGGITLNANFMDGTADKLVISGEITGSGATTITLMATGTAADLPSDMFLTLVEAPTDTGAAGDFTLSGFTLTRSTSGASNGHWVITGTGPTSGGTPDPDPDPDPEPMLMLVDGTCTEQDATPGRFACSGAITTAQMLEAGTGETLNVTTHGDNFSVTAATGAALDLNAGSGSTGMDITLTGPVTASDTATTAHAIDAYTTVSNTTGDMTITTTEAATIMASGGDGIHVDNNGNGTTSITTNAAITSTSGHGISVTAGGIEGDTDRSTSITANAMITTSATDKSGIHTSQQSGATGDVTITAADIMSGGEGIRATSLGDAATAMSITATGSITATSEGIQALHRRTGDVTITVNPGASVSGSIGIDADAGTNNTESDIIIEVAGSVTGTTNAITMDRGAEHTLRLRPGFSLMGAVTSDATDADDNPNATLELAASAADDADTDTSAEFDLSTLDSFTGFSVFEKTGDGTWTLTGTQTAAEDDTDRAFTSADVMGGTLQLGDGTTAAIMELAANASFILSDSALEFMGTGNMISGSETAGEEATLRLAGASGGSFNLADLSHFTNFATFEKTDAGTWTLTGNQPDANAFTSASVTEGTLRLDGSEAAVTFRPGSSTLSIGSSATSDPAAILETLGNATLAGALVINATGTANLAGSTIMGNLTNAGSLNISGDTNISGALSNTGSATVTLDMDFTDPAAPSTEQLTLGSVTAGGTPTEISLRIASDRDLSDADIPADLPPLVAVSGSSSAADFTEAAGENHCTVIGGRGNCSFTLNHTAGTGWQLETLLLELPTSNPTYEGYAATLTSLSQLPGMSARLANRIHDPRNAIWGQIQGEQTTLKPNATSPNAEYDMQHSRVRFGFDVPATPFQGAFDTAPVLGFNAWLGQSQTDITATDAEPGEIETDAFGAAATATLQQGVFHFDGQLQYAAFSSDIAVAGSSRANNLGGDAITAAAEIGMKLPEMHGITLTPQVQLSWTSIDFDAFADSEDSRISLADGETTSARLGITATAPLATLTGGTGAAKPGIPASGQTLLHASANLHLPLDGETSARIGDNTAISDLEEESLSLGIGMSHNWNATTLSADLATTQGEDTETYRASLSATLAF